MINKQSIALSKKTLESMITNILNDIKQVCLNKKKISPTIFCLLSNGEIFLNSFVWVSELDRLMQTKKFTEYIASVGCMMYVFVCESFGKEVNTLENSKEELEKMKEDIVNTGKKFVTIYGEDYLTNCFFVTSEITDKGLASETLHEEVDFSGNYSRQMFNGIFGKETKH
jgi:hypothetical protein